MTLSRINLTADQISDFLSNYPRLVDGKRRTVKMAVKAPQKVVDSVKTRIPEKVAYEGMYVCADALHAGFAIRDDAIYTDDAEAANKYCSITNAFYGYSETEVRIMVHLSLGNTILETYDNRVCLIPGKQPSDN